MKFTDKQFFDWEIEHGLFPGGHNKGFYDVHKKLADFILNIGIKSHIDLGGGNSPLCKILQDNSVNTLLFEQNKYSIKLQQKLGLNYWYNEDFTTFDFTSIQADVITSIEVFEHIEDSKLLPFISDLANHCKYFIFSSTPHKDTPEFDEQWGHVNIKPSFKWVQLFQNNGFQLMENETDYLRSKTIPTDWVLMFKSMKHA